VLADSTPTKRRQALEAVAKLQDPTTEADIQGHQDVWAIVVYRAHVMPVGLRLDVQTTPCPSVGVTCRKPTEWAAQLIRECKPPRGVKVLSLFEADDLGPMGVKAGRAPPFHFASPLQSHRRLFKQGWQRKAGRYGRQLPRRRRPDPLALTKPDGQVRDRGVDAGWLEVSTLGPLHVVFSRKGMATKSLGLVTDAPALSAADVIGTDAKRWTMEPWRKAVKPWLGLG
jgi:hypothetical protein